ncbi:MAG: hypothetical protein ACFFB9_13210 [Promethearchaeota archaeon]
MDFKDFHDGLLSLTLILFMFSITLLIGVIILKPYTGIYTQERNLIVVLCSINIFYSLYYLWNVFKLHKIFSLETKNIIKFAKKIGIITIIYIPHVFVFMSLFFRNLHNLEILMISLLIIMEISLISIVFKEVYDLIFLEKSRRDAEIEKDRKKYIETEHKLNKKKKYRY